MTRISDTPEGNVLLAGSSIPGIMSELNLFLAKVQHRATENALDAYLSGYGTATDVADALEKLTYDDCRKLGEYVVRPGENSQAHRIFLVAYNSTLVTEQARKLAIQFREAYAG